MGSSCAGVGCGAGGNGAHDVPQGGIGSGDSPEAAQWLQAMSDGIAAVAEPFEMAAAPSSMQAFSSGLTRLQELALATHGLRHGTDMCLKLASGTAKVIAWSEVGAGLAAGGLLTASAYAALHPSPRFAYPDQPTEGHGAPEPTTLSAANDSHEARLKLSEALNAAAKAYLDGLSVDEMTCPEDLLEQSIALFDFDRIETSMDPARVADLIMLRMALRYHESDPASAVEKTARDIECLEIAKVRQEKISEALRQLFNELFNQRGEDGSNLGLDWKNALDSAGSASEATAINKEFTQRIRSMAIERLGAIYPPTEAKSMFSVIPDLSIAKRVSGFVDTSDKILASDQDPLTQWGELYREFKAWLTDPWPTQGAINH